MSATIAAALKKIAVYLLTDKKALKIAGGILLGAIVIIAMPIAALIGIFNGDINIDTDRLHEMVQEKNGALMERWAEVETAMTDAGYEAIRIQEAQLLFSYVLYNHAEESDFTDRFVGCFAAEQTDEELIAAVNAAFGTTVTVEEFQNAIAGTRNAYIKTSHYTDPETKNNLDLVLWAEFAADNHWGYVYGTYASVLDDALLESKITQYPDEVGGSADFIREHWLGKRTVDCIGLIKGYSWYDVQSQTIILSTNGMPDVNANTMYENATEKDTIDTIPEIPGLAVWQDGHIGVYIGNGVVVEAYGTTTGVIRSQLSDGAWTHWLKIPYITYPEQEDAEDPAASESEESE